MDPRPERDRQIWSCRLCELPGEDELASLEDALRQGGVSFWEDARMLARYLHVSRLSQAECAARLGRSQSAVANRLRVLRLPEDMREAMARHGLSERHARAMLRLPEKLMRRALDTVVALELNVAETEALAEELLRSPPDQIAALPEELLPVLDVLYAAGLPFTVTDLPEETRVVIRLQKKREKSK